MIIVILKLLLHMCISFCILQTKAKLLFQIFTKRGGEQKHIKDVLDLRDLLRKMKDKICRLRIKKTSHHVTEKTKGY